MELSFAHQSTTLWLPDLVVHDIIEALDTASLSRVSCVCRTLKGVAAEIAARKLLAVLKR